MINNSITKFLDDVRESVQAETKVYLPLFKTAETPPGNWLINDFIPTLVFLPSAVADFKVQDFERATEVAFALELSYLGHFFHRLAPKTGCGADYRMAILVGDYLSAAAAAKLSTEKFIQWSEDIGKVICDLSQGSMELEGLETSSLEKSRFENFKSENLQPKNCTYDNSTFDQVLKVFQLIGGSLGKLAGDMAVETVKMPEVEKLTYIEFATLAGVLQSIKVSGYDLIYPLEFANLQNDCLEILVNLPKFEATAKALVLEKIMESNGLNDERNVGEGEKQAGREASFKAI